MGFGPIFQVLLLLVFVERVYLGVVCGVVASEIVWTLSSRGTQRYHEKLGIRLFSFLFLMGAAWVPKVPGGSKLQSAK